MNCLATFTFTPSPVGLRAMRLFIKTYADGAGLDFETANDLCVAAGEAVNNAIEHGGAPGEPLTLRWFENNDALELRIQDRSPQKAPGAKKGKVDLAVVEDRERGVGLYLMQALVDEVRVAAGPKGGNEVTLVKRKGKTP